MSIFQNICFKHQLSKISWKYCEEQYCAQSQLYLSCRAGQMWQDELWDEMITTTKSKHGREIGVRRRRIDHTDMSVPAVCTATGGNIAWTPPTTKLLYGRSRAAVVLAGTLRLHCHNCSRPNNIDGIIFRYIHLIYTKQSQIAANIFGNPSQYKCKAVSSVNMVIGALSNYG